MSQREVLRNMLREELDKASGKRLKEEKAAEAPKAKRPGKDAVRRPGGKTYMPRELRGKPDVDVLRTLRERSLYALLYGPPGTGKTALAEAAFNGELHVITGDENTNADDFIGQWVPTGDAGKWTWVNGPLISAARDGGVLFIDDITLIDPRVLAVIYPAMDGRGEIIVKSHIVDGRPEAVKIGKGFYVIGAHNPGVHGAVLTDALSSRFLTQILVETDPVLAASLGTPERMQRLARMLRAEQENDPGQWVPQLREMLAFRDMAQAYGEEMAAANLIGVCPEGPDRDKLQEKMQLVFGKEINRLQLGEQL